MLHGDIGATEQINSRDYMKLAWFTSSGGVCVDIRHNEHPKHQKKIHTSELHKNEHTIQFYPKCESIK